MLAKLVNKRELNPTFTSCLDVNNNISENDVAQVTTNNRTLSVYL